MLTFKSVVWDPNKVKPFTLICAAIWAGPVSFAITNELSFINEDNWEISNALPLSKMQSASISLAFFISKGPGAIIILNLLWYLFLIFWINSL